MQLRYTVIIHVLVGTLYSTCPLHNDFIHTHTHACTPACPPTHTHLREFPDSQCGVGHVVVVVLALAITGQTPPLGGAAVGVDGRAGDGVNLLGPTTGSYFLCGGSEIRQGGGSEMRQEEGRDGGERLSHSIMRGMVKGHYEKKTEEGKGLDGWVGR